MPNPATTADLEARWRPLSAQETTVGQTLLDDAWRMLRRHFTKLGVDLDANVVTDADLSAEVVRVEAVAVLRVLKNPDGMAQESIDDYRYLRADGNATGELYFTDEELESLYPGSGESGGAFSIDPLYDYEARFTP